MPKPPTKKEIIGLIMTLHWDDLDFIVGLNEMTFSRKVALRKEQAAAKDAGTVPA